MGEKLTDDGASKRIELETVKTRWVPLPTLALATAHQPLKSCSKQFLKEALGGCDFIASPSQHAHQFCQYIESAFSPSAGSPIHSSLDAS